MENKDILPDIRERMARVEANQENLNKAIQSLATSVEKLVTKLDESDDVAKKADERAKSAHHRIDDIEDHHKWWSRKVIGGFVLGVISIIMFFLKEGFSK